MKRERLTLWTAGEYSYEGSHGFIPFLTAYIHEEDNAVRPCMLVVPGGGYCVVSPTEGEIVARRFYEEGYNAFVCTYTTDISMSIPLKDQPMKDISRAIRLLRKRAAEYSIDPGRVVICGFSAGGHLCASVCVHHEDIGDSSEEYRMISNRPDAAVLSYPVISSGSYAHEGSFAALLGAEATQEERDYMSLERHVNRHTPPCFLWHTATDETVPVENSLLFAKACRKAKVPFALHIFSEGQHGLSLANEEWASGQYGEPYTIEQAICLAAFLKERQIPVPDQLDGFLGMMGAGRKGELSEEQKAAIASMKPNREVARWPELAAAWLQNILD